MNKKENTKNLIIQQGLLPLYYNDSSEISIGVLRALYKAGIQIVEYTNRGNEALDNFISLKKILEFFINFIKVLQKINFIFSQFFAVG